MGFIGDLVGAGGSNDAARTQFEAAKKWDEMEVLSPEEKARKAKQLYDSGLLTPDQYQVTLQDPSALDKFTSDPRLREAQMRSLDYLTKVGTEGGLTAEDRARQNQINNRNATEARGAREAGAQRMQARGMGGSGMSALQSMLADESAATQNYLGGTEVAANAERRALDAMSKAGEMGGSIRTQDFSEAERKAAASDAINRFNTQAKNIGEAANVDARNRAREGARSMYDTNYDERLKKQQGWSSAYTGQAPFQEEAGRREDKGVGGAFQWGEGLASMFSDENVKDNVEPAQPDIENFLANLEPKKWDYKDPKYGSTSGQENVGVMAQDMEKSPLGKAFVSEDKEGVKRIDYGKAQSTMLAILKSLSDRMDRQENNDA
jgi:hypothetical protein